MALLIIGFMKRASLVPSEFPSPISFPTCWLLRWPAAHRVRALARKAGLMVSVLTPMASIMLVRRRWSFTARLWWVARFRMVSSEVVPQVRRIMPLRENWTGPMIRGIKTEFEYYTYSSLNDWAPINADDALALVYLPMSGEIPDNYGGQRRPFDDAISSSVITLDADTRLWRGRFQTTYHDMWDYDVPSQSALEDIANRRWVPACSD